MRKIRKGIPSPAMVVACLALTIALSGVGYAAVVLPRNSVGTAQLKTSAVTAQKIKAGNVTRGKIVANAINSAKVADGTLLAVDVAPNTFVGAGASAGGDLIGPFGNLQLNPGVVSSPEVLDDTQLGGGLNSEDIRPLHGDIDIIDNTITTFDIAADAIDSDEVVDFGLSNADIGVLFAQVNANGTIANSSGGVIGTRIGLGTYDVDFGRNISNCAFVITQGEAGVGGAGDAITGATDRSGNVEAVFATTRDAANVLADRAFQLVVVC
jgi:hypothetical protein